jgi:glycosyltransferase involved in cell wall biosynthesis
MRIGIDIRYLSHGLLGGVHTYVASLVPALLRAAPQETFFLYADEKASLELEGLPANAQVRLLPYHSPLSSLANDLRLNEHMARDGVEVAHFPANYGFGPNGARTIITLHDEINILPLRKILRGHPKQPRTIATMCYLHTMSTAAVRRADRLLTVSEHARRRIAQVGVIPANRIVAVHSAPPAGTRRVEDAAALARVRNAFNLNRRFILADALKNPAALLRAWAVLDAPLRESVEVVFFCRTPNLPDALRAAVARNSVRVIIRPTRDELLALYSLCDAFVFPSWIEGFGLPVLEAMACGAPVIASDRGSLPEVVGQAGLICDAEDHAAIAAYLALLLTQPAVADMQRRKGYAHAARFTWERTAQAVLEVYRNHVAPQTTAFTHAVGALEAAQ